MSLVALSNSSLLDTFRLSYRTELHYLQHFRPHVEPHYLIYINASRTLRIKGVVVVNLTNY